ncbi:MAG: GNAT family N-acetyltransferase [Rickettsiales bacterium]|nr:GNAT family N-acetyltransferase [Rickettsiales bacterium]
MKNLIYRPAEQADLSELREFSIRTMVEKFGHIYQKEDLDQHLAEDYSPEYHQQAFKNSNLLLVTDKSKIIGYAKWGEMGLPLEKPITPCGEVHRLYVDDAYRGQKIGHTLMQHMMEDMAEKKAIYLSVFSENKGAHRFYHRYGFSKKGEYKYMVGSHADHEFIYGLER